MTGIFVLMHGLTALFTMTAKLAKTTKNMPKEYLRELRGLRDLRALPRDSSF